MKKIVDSFGFDVKPWEVLQGRDGHWYSVTDLVPEDPVFTVGAVFEGGDPEEEGDYFAASFFHCEVIEA